jgi:hypothetical protein
MMALRTVLAAALLLGATAPAAIADETFASVAAGECRLSLEASANWPTLRLRAGHPRHRPCRIEKTDMIGVLEQAFAEPRPALAETTFTSLAIGRLIDYPWLVQFLAFRAACDPGWDAVSGKPIAANINRYAADLLFSPEVIRALEEPLRGQGYRITGVAVEKVLVGGFENVPQLEGPRRNGKIPFDAQVWFQLKRDRY